MKKRKWGADIDRRRRPEEKKKVKEGIKKMERMTKTKNKKVKKIDKRRKKEIIEKQTVGKKR